MPRVGTWTPSRLGEGSCQPSDTVGLVLVTVRVIMVTVGLIVVTVGLVVVTVGLVVVTD